MSNISPARRVSARLAAIQESATLAVDAKAKALKAAGRPVIGFGAGEPDFPTPGFIVEAAVAAARDPKNHKYTPAKGLPELREAIAARALADSGVTVSPDDILVTNGGKQAVFEAFAAIVDDGDEVLLPTPYWTTYPEAIRLAGGVPVKVFAGAGQDYKVAVDQLEAARTPATKALLLCSPSNPTGSVYSPEEIRSIGQWAAANGWRVGWMHGPADAVKAAANMQSHATSNVANVSQRAAIAALTGDQGVVEEMRQAFDRRRRTMVRMLREVEGMAVPEPKGAFYVYPNVEGLLGRDIRGRTAATSSELAAIILEETEVAAVPGEAFGPSGFLRLSYALSDDDLVEGVSRIQDLLAG